MTADTRYNWEIGCYNMFKRKMEDRDGTGIMSYEAVEQRRRDWIAIWKQLWKDIPKFLPQ